MTPLLLIRGLTRTFTARDGSMTPALRATDLAVSENDFVTILGPSGCGKSTLLRIVAGLDRPTSGEVLLECPFRRGTGTDYWCYEDRCLAEEHPFVEGLLSGVQRWWVDEGSVFEETHWREGQPHGPRRRWKKGALEAGYPELFIRGKQVSRRVYLLALRTDTTLPVLRREDDHPRRVLPNSFVRLRERALRKHGRAPGRKPLAWRWRD